LAPMAPPLNPGYVSSIASLCTETCYYDDDGYCDDGGTGSSYFDCDYGSDCADCGTRSDPSLALCTSCPLECNNKGAADRDTSNWCLEAAWGANGVCDPACNNAECDHDGSDCTLSEAVDECKPLQAAQGAALVTVAGSKANVEFNIIEMMPFNVVLDDTTNQWKMEIEMTISLRWSDSRLRTAECRKKLNEMLSFDSDATAQTREELETNRALLYMPSFEVNKTTMTYLSDMIADPGAIRNEVTSAKFDWRIPSHTWMGGGAAPDGSVECTDCVGQTLSFTRAIGIVPSLSFATYPFDIQDFQVRFDLGQHVNAFTCNSLLDDPASKLAQLQADGELASVLPTTNEYQLRGLGAVTVAHPIGPDGLPLTGKCDLIFRVRRDSSIVFLKVIIPTIIIVYVGLLSVFLSADDHTGDRAALLSVSILICMINLERDHGLGKLMYSTWFDMFNLIQLGMQMIALLESLLEHRLIKTCREAESLLLNKVWAPFVIFGAYPVLTVCILLYGADHKKLAYVLAAVLLPAMSLLAIHSFRSRLNAGRQLRVKLAKSLSETGFSSDGFEALFAKAFVAYDLDSSGSLDADEIRTLLKAIFGKDKTLYTAAIEIATKLQAASGGSLSLEACQDIFTTLELAGHSMGGPEARRQANRRQGIAGRPRLAVAAQQLMARKRSMKKPTEGSSPLGLRPPKAGLPTTEAAGMSGIARQLMARKLSKTKPTEMWTPPKANLPMTEAAYDQNPHAVKTTPPWHAVCPAAATTEAAPGPATYDQNLPTVEAARQFSPRLLPPTPWHSGSSTAAPGPAGGVPQDVGLPIHLLGIGRIPQPGLHVHDENDENDKDC